MLKQLIQHRWICFVQGGLTVLLGMGLLSLRPLIEDRLVGTFVAIVVLLSISFVLVAAGLLDLVIGVDVAAHRHKLRDALMWWLPGAVGLGMGLVVMLAPRVTMGVVAVVAAGHALLLTAFDLALLPSLTRHPWQRNMLLASCFFFVVLGVMLVIGALGTEAMATQAIGLYALYFGLRLMFLGGQLAVSHHSPIAVS
jgi:hypothetical protein